MRDRSLWILGILGGALGACAPRDTSEESARLALETAPCPAGEVRRGDICEKPLWEAVTPLPAHTQRMLDLIDVDGREAWIVGTGGLLLHSADGGTTFERIDAGTEEDATSVWADSRQLVVTLERRALVSRDAGRRFTQSPEAPADLTSCVASLDVVLCGAEDGSVHRWELGAPQFERAAIAAGSGPSVVRAGSSHVLVAIQKRDSVEILATRDAGRHFQSTSVPGASARTLWASADSLLACLAGVKSPETSLFCSTDGGATFARRGAEPLSQNCRVEGIAGAGDVVRILTRCRFGGTLDEYHFSPGRTLSTWPRGVGATRLVSFGTPNHGLLLTARLLRTVDGTQSFAPIDETPLELGFRGREKGSLGGMLFPSATRGYVVATAPPNTRLPEYWLYRTDDGVHFDEGRFVSRIGGGDGELLMAAHGDRLWLATRYKPIGDNFARSEDGGKTFLGHGFPFPNSDIGALALGPNGLGIVVAQARGLHTSDGGESFRQIELPVADVRAVAFVDASRVVAVGRDGAILTSNDGGQSFAVRGKYAPGGVLQALAFAPGSRVGWAGGKDAAGRGILLRTDDGGETFTPQEFDGSENAEVMQIAAATTSQATAVIDSFTTNRYSLVATLDGGASRWRSRPTPAGEWIRSISRPPESNVIYAYSPLGLYRSFTP